MSAIDHDGSALELPPTDEESLAEGAAAVGQGAETEADVVELIVMIREVDFEKAGKYFLALTACGEARRTDVAEDAGQTNGKSLCVFQEKMHCWQILPSILDTNSIEVQFTVTQLLSSRGAKEIAAASVTLGDLPKPVTEGGKAVECKLVLMSFDRRNPSPVGTAKVTLQLLNRAAAERARREAEAAAERVRLEAEATQAEAEAARLEAEVAEQARMAADRARMEAEAAERARIGAKAAERARMEADAIQKARKERARMEMDKWENFLALAATPPDLSLTPRADACCFAYTQYKERCGSEGRRALALPKDVETDWVPASAVQGTSFMHGDKVAFRGREMWITSGRPGKSGLAEPGRLVKMRPVVPMLSAVERETDPLLQAARKLFNAVDLNGDGLIDEPEGTAIRCALGLVQNWWPALKEHARKTNCMVHPNTSAVCFSQFADYITRVHFARVSPSDAQAALHTAFEQQEVTSMRCARQAANTQWGHLRNALRVASTAPRNLL